METIRIWVLFELEHWDYQFDQKQKSVEIMSKETFFCDSFPILDFIVRKCIFNDLYNHFCVNHSMVSVLCEVTQTQSHMDSMIESPQYYIDNMITMHS